MIKITEEMYEKVKQIKVMEAITKDGVYTCKSSTSKNEWTVIFKNNEYTCDCPSFKKGTCKHIIAVQIYEKKEFEVDIKEKKVDDKSDPNPIKIPFGFDRYEVISAFHKSLRKGDTKKSWYFLEIMIQSNFGVWYINNYISSIIAEELCICNPQIVVGLKSYLNPSAKSIDNYSLYAVVDIFCSLPKFWQCERCWERKVYNAKNIMNIRESKNELYDIPYYAHDRHTAKGARLPEDKIDWRFAGTWFSMYWRRECIKQGLDINTAKWEDVKLDKDELEFFKKLGVK